MSAGKHPQRSPDLSREPVRRGQLNEVLNRFNDALNRDFGTKTTVTLVKYHVKQIEPRFQRLERLPWNWLAFRLVESWDWFVKRATERWDKKPAQPVVAPEDSTEPPAAAEPGAVCET